MPDGKDNRAATMSTQSTPPSGLDHPKAGDSRQLAAMNIPQALGYTKIAGTPVVTGFYTLLPPLLAFAVPGSSHTAWALPTPPRPQSLRRACRFVSISVFASSVSCWGRTPDMRNSAC